MQPLGNTRSDRKVSTSVGTAVRLVSTNTPCRRVTIQALPTNTNWIAIGDSSVLCTAGSEKGTFLSAGSSVTMYIEDLYQIYLDVLTSGEGVTYVYEF